MYVTQIYTNLFLITKNIFSLHTWQSMASTLYGNKAEFM